MALTQCLVRIGVGCWIAAVTGFVEAAVVGGIFDTAAADGRSIVIKVGAEQKAMTFRLSADTKITLNNKPAKLSDLQSGQRVSVFTTGADSAASISAHTATTATGATTKPAVAPNSPATAAKPTTGSPAPASAAVVAGGGRAGGSPWPQFRGPNRDGVSTEKGFLKQWPAEGPKLLWTAQGLGAGYSSVSIAGGKVLTMGTVNNRQSVLAVDLNTGKPLWMAPSGAPFDNDRGGGPRCVPTIDGDAAYALDAEGNLVCVGLEDGKQRWGVNILSQFGGSNITWGISESPLVDGNQVVCSPGGPQATLVALNKQNGAPLWRAAVPGNPEASYASAIAVTAGGVRQYVHFTAAGVVGVRSSDGQVLWGDTNASNRTANCSAPIFLQDSVFYASGYGTGGALVRLSGAGSQLAYKTRDMKNHHGGMVAVDGYVYGSDDSILTCLELATGKVMWQDRSVGKSSVTYADGRLYVRSEDGPLALVECTSQGYREISRFTPPTSNSKTWAYPVAASGKLFIRDQDSLLCYDIRDPSAAGPR